MNAVLTPSIKLVPNSDETYDLILEYNGIDVEFAEELDVQKSIKSHSKTITKSILSQAKKVKIKSVKVLVSGVLVATVAFSSFLSALATTDRYIMGYLYRGNDIQQIEYVNQTNNALDTVSPSYFNIREDGSLKLNYLSSYFIKSMHDRGIKVVPFLSNHWNRTAGINALQNVESLSMQIADYIEEYNLDGVNVDIENVTHEQRDQYTEFVRLLREKVPAHKEISVAVAANPNNWQVGWHGSYDYSALAEYADHLLIMAYDEHYEGSEAGPVASINFVENSIKYALSKTAPDKIVVGVPFYGRVWSLDDNRIVGKGASTKTIQEIIQNCDATVTYDEASQSAKVEFTITESSGQYTVGGDFVLQPGRYVAWFETDQSYQEKLNLIEKYNLKGAGAWSLGQEDISIWDHYEDWVNGDAADEELGADPPIVELPAPPTGDSTDSPSEETYSNAWIKADQINVPIYKNENLKGKIVATLSGGTAVTVLKEAGNGAYQVQLSDDQVGYISSSYVTFEKQEPTPEQIPDSSTPSVPSSETFLYEVKAGDSLWKLAERYLGDGSRYPEIMELNGLTSTTIFQGMQLQIPGSSEGSQPGDSYVNYTVKRGDSLWKIARAQLGSGSRYPEIIELNGLTSATIYPGQILKLPK